MICLNLLKNNLTRKPIRERITIAMSIIAITEPSAIAAMRTPINTESKRNPIKADLS